MRFLPWWRGQRYSDPAGNRLERFRNLLEAAMAVPLYRSSLRAAELDSKRAIHSITDIESVLSRLGVFSLEQVRIRPPRAIEAPVEFHSPLALGVEPNLFWNRAGCAMLRDVSGSKEVHRALFIRIGVDEGLLAPIERDGLWQRYGVPMFEHLVGMDGELLAWECEAHSGLHIVEENAVFESIHGELLLTSLTDLRQPTLQTRTGWTARVETDACDCGRAGGRLMGLSELPRHGRAAYRADGLAAAAHQ